MSKQVLAVKVIKVDNHATCQLRNGNSGSFSVALKTEILPGKSYWSQIPATFLTEEAASKKAKQLANKFNCKVEK